MGLMLSTLISYVGILEAIELIKHIRSGLLPNSQPDFQDLVDYYTKELRKLANTSFTQDWVTQCGQGYLCLSEDENGKLKSASVKFYHDPANTTAILFSTKITSFGQDSVESNSSLANGDYRNERYTPTRTKTIVTNTLESFSVGNREKSPTTSEKFLDENHYSPNSLEQNENDTKEENEATERLTWRYRPLSPSTETLPEIHFESYDGDEHKNDTYSEDYLRSLDGIKLRPLQRSDPSGRRKSFRKRHSSSSNSSKDSRASREEELKMFTSLEEAEFKNMNSDENVGGFGSAPNLVPRSYSRSRSRENSKERRNDTWSMDASIDSLPEDDCNKESKPRLKTLGKLDSFEEENEGTKESHEVTEEELDDFWGNSGD